MNIIISEAGDVTTNLVIEWLLSNQTKFKRLNSEESLNNFSFYLSNKDSKIIFNKKVPEKVWHRRGRLCLYPKDKYSSLIHNYIKEEADAVIKSVEIYLKSKLDYTGSFLKEKENYKLTQLEVAKNCELKIPNTLVTTDKQELISFVKTNKSCITKDIRYPVYISNEDKVLLSTGTKIVTKKMIDSLEEVFAPVLVQGYVKKQYEIRVFFHKNKFYPMAIFSQKNPKTKIDFRNYDETLPNRCVPVQLPLKVHNKLKHFVKEYEINTGSIDLICTPNNEYVFLEINPQGQLDWVSKNCNYYIEKNIAQELTS